MTFADSVLTESEIARRAIRVIEEIAMAREGFNTEEERAFGEIFKLAHWARSPECRKNHPTWGDALATKETP